MLVPLVVPAVVPAPPVVPVLLLVPAPLVELLAADVVPALLAPTLEETPPPVDPTPLPVL